MKKPEEKITFTLEQIKRMLRQTRLLETGPARSEVHRSYQRGWRQALNFATSEFISEAHAKHLVLSHARGNRKVPK